MFLIKVCNDILLRLLIEIFIESTFTVHILHAGPVENALHIFFFYLQYCTICFELECVCFTN